MSENVENVSSSLKHFGIFDYAVFLIMLMSCSCVGLYFGYQDHKQRKNKGPGVAKKGSEAVNYLLGGKNVQVFPGAFLKKVFGNLRRK